MDAAESRIRRDVQADFEQAVEAVRTGTIVAHDQKAYSRWKSRTVTRSGRPGRDLAQLKRDLGGNVETGGFEFRH